MFRLDDWTYLFSCVCVLLTYECFLTLYFYDDKRPHAVTFMRSDITAAKLKTTSSHKLHRTEEILQVKQNLTFSFSNISVTFLWTFGYLEEHQILTDHISVSGDLNNQSHTAVPCIHAHRILTFWTVFPPIYWQSAANSTAVWDREEYYTFSFLILLWLFWWEQCKISVISNLLIYTESNILG